MTEYECVNGWVCLDTENRNEIILGHATEGSFIVTKVRKRKFMGAIEELAEEFAQRFDLEDGMHRKSCVPLELNASLWYCDIFTFKKQRESVCFHYTIISNYYIVFESIYQSNYDVIVIERDLNSLTKWLSESNLLCPTEYLEFDTKMIEITPASDLHVCRNSNKKSIIFTNESKYIVVTLDSTDKEVYFNDIEKMIYHNNCYEFRMNLVNEEETYNLDYKAFHIVANRIEIGCIIFHHLQIAEKCFLSILIFDCRFQYNQVLEDLITFQVKGVSI